MGTLIDLVGETFGRLTVTCRVANDRAGRASWYCSCSCGGFKIIDSKALRTGKTASCGCLCYSHQQSGSPLYKVWASMRERCNNPRAKSFAHYGARGITVCERWAGFELFLADMGPRPNGYSIERRDNDGNYEPGNCYWATDFEQAQNTRRTRLITVGGDTRTITEWTRKLGGSVSMIHCRLKRGWTEEAACLTPVQTEWRKRT